MSLEFLLVSATILIFATLALAGYRHLRDDSLLGSALHLRFGIDPLTCARLASLIACYELALGTGGLVSAVVGPRVLVRILTGGALVTYAVYTWYVASLLTRAGDAPCGCSSDSVPANRGTVARTLALAAAAAFALLAAVDGPTLQALPAGVVLMAILAGATFTSLLWSLPSAMAGLPPKAAGGQGQFLGLPPKAVGGQGQFLGLPPKAVGGQGQFND
ncbi:MAG: hypothetical protein ABR592_06380 [Nitriliruptorales bacterium]